MKDIGIFLFELKISALLGLGSRVDIVKLYYVNYFLSWHVTRSFGVQRMREVVMMIMAILMIMVMLMILQNCISTEELTEEMANIEGLMKDLNNITRLHFSY